MDFSEKNYIEYINSIKHYNSLTKTEEMENFINYKKTGDYKYRNNIINANLKWVVKIAINYYITNNNMNLMELITVGNDGLFKAFEKYNPEIYQNKFFTYATTWIRVYISNYIKNEEKIFLEDYMNKEKDEEISYEDRLNKETYETIMLDKLLNGLTVREKEIISKLYGLNYTKKYNMVEIAQEYNLSCERISKIKERALLKLRINGLSELNSMSTNPD